MTEILIAVIIHESQGHCSIMSTLSVKSGCLSDYLHNHVNDHTCEKRPHANSCGDRNDKDGTLVVYREMALPTTTALSVFALCPLNLRHCCFYCFSRLGLVSRRPGILSVVELTIQTKNPAKNVSFSTSEIVESKVADSLIQSLPPHLQILYYKNTVC